MLSDSQPNDLKAPRHLKILSAGKKEINGWMDEWRDRKREKETYYRKWLM